MSQHSTHFLLNIQAFSPLKLRLSKTTPSPHLPSVWRKKRKTIHPPPVKTIFLFNPTGSQRGRLKREWASCTLTAQRSLLPSPTDHHSAMSGNEEQGKGERKGKATTSKETHTFHTSFQQEKAAVTRNSPDGSSIPGAEQQKGTDNSHSPDTSVHLNKR